MVEGRQLQPTELCLTIQRCKRYLSMYSFISQEIGRTHTRGSVHLGLWNAIACPADSVTAQILILLNFEILPQCSFTLSCRRKYCSAPEFQGPALFLTVLFHSLMHWLMQGYTIVNVASLKVCCYFRREISLPPLFAIQKRRIMKNRPLSLEWVISSSWFVFSFVSPLNHPYSLPHLPFFLPLFPFVLLKKFLNIH